jgi:hypothetical protein
MKEFNSPYFTKKCKNCEYRVWNFFYDDECTLSGKSCMSERMHPVSCGENFENWKPNKKALKELIKLRKEFPQFFI